MKKVTAYVNVLQIQSLVKALGAIGIREVEILEHYSTAAKISRIKLVCGDGQVDQVESMIYQIARTDSACDSCFFVRDTQSLMQRTSLHSPTV